MVYLDLNIKKNLSSFRFAVVHISIALSNGYYQDIIIIVIIIIIIIIVIIIIIIIITIIIIYFTYKQQRRILEFITSALQT